MRDLAPNGRYFEWYTYFKVQKYILGGTFSVHVFIGSYLEDPRTWLTAPNHVGTFTVFANPPDSGCEKCEADQENNLQVTGQVPLTIALLERFLARKITSLTPDVIVQYLQTNLHWRVAMADGTERGRGDVDDLTVSVASNGVTVPPSSDILPTYDAEVTLCSEITTKVNGGSRGDGTGLTQNGMLQPGNV